jgi:hypothetical protein
VAIDYSTVTTRYVRIRITANTGWPAGQLSELEVYGPATGDTQAPTAPGNLAFTEPAAGQIRLTWTASTDNVGVTGYDVYANGQLRTSLVGNVLTYTDYQPAGVPVSYFVRAKDAAGNQSANSETITRSGGSGPGSNLALLVEHMVCLYWGANTDNSTIRNSRIRNMFADGINMTNGSAGNLVSNNDARATGDDSFALFNATDSGGGEVRDNVFENLSATLTWRAAGFAVYGGTNKEFRTLYAADMLTYPQCHVA